MKEAANSEYAISQKLAYETGARRICLTALLSMTKHADGVADVAGIEPKQMSTWLVRMSAMLSGKTTPLVEAIELHEEP
jgi:hypothetical protein